MKKVPCTACNATGYDAERQAKQRSDRQEEVRPGVWAYFKDGKELGIKTHGFPCLVCGGSKSMTTPYNPGQAEFVFKFLDRPPQWLILGGPADADEAQTFRRRFPDIKVLAVEPCAEMVEWQLANGFPSDGLLINKGLAAEPGVMTLVTPSGEARCSSFVYPMTAERKGAKCNVEVTTLDDLWDRYGPFPDSVLWLDIEGMEYSALVGGLRLLASGEVQLINVEVLRRTEKTEGKKVEEALTRLGYVRRDHWDVRSGNHYDVIYTRGKS